MKVLLPAVGSAGDVHPCLAIGRALQARGHDVEVLANPFFEDMVAKAGLQFFPIGTRAQQEDTFSSAKLWHHIDGLGVLWRRLARHAVCPVYERVTERFKQTPCVVVANPLVVGARLANERWGVPLITAYTAATQLRSSLAPVTLAHLRVPGWLPAGLMTLAWQALDRWKLEPMVQPDLAPLRHALGLPALGGGTFGDWIHSPQKGLALFPAWFAPPPGDWPPQVAQAGFPLFDTDAEPGLEPALDEFLRAGAPPIVFTPGSAMVHGDAFFAAALGTCHKLGMRGVLLGPGAGRQSLALPPSLTHCRYAPFSLLLPRAAALVHHGGIGSCAQALRAGIPQLVRPMSFDQFDNAVRLERLGVADTIPLRDQSLLSISTRLQRLLASAAVAAACQKAAAQLRCDRPLQSICDAIESAQ